MNDVKLLPLPATSWQLNHDDATGAEIAPTTPLWNAAKMQSYARACVEAALEAARVDAERLDWLDANGFTAYRGIDPIDGLSGHCVVVHETQLPRRGNVADTIRAAIDAARKEVE